MFSLPRVLRLDRRFFSLKYVVESSKVRCLPACFQVYTARHLRTNAVELERKHFDDVISACSEKNRKRLFFSLERTENYRARQDVLFGDESKPFIDEIFSESPIDDVGMALLKFMLRHGVPDSESEKKVIEKLLSEIDSYNALGMACIIDCVQYVDTKLRRTLVTNFEDRLKKGLSAQTWSQITKSLKDFQNTPLQPYMLQYFFDKLGIYTAPLETYPTVLNFLRKNNLQECALVNKMEQRLTSFTYKKFRFSIPNIETLLRTHNDLGIRNGRLLRRLTSHLKVALSLLEENEVGGFKYSAFLQNSLVSYAVCGYYDKELIHFLSKIFFDQEQGLITINFFCALNMLNHHDMPLSKEMMSTVLWKNEDLMSAKLMYMFVRAMVDMKYLEIKDVERLKCQVEQKLEENISNPSIVSTYFLLKAYSELDLALPFETSVNEDDLIKLLPDVSTMVGPLKSSVKFVAGLLCVEDDESLIKSFYFNQYGCMIDLDFYVDDQGTIRPESHGDNLTRIILVVLKETDMVIQQEGSVNFSYQPRGPQNMRMRHLTKSENAIVIPIHFDVWYSLEDRHKRKKYLQSSIQSKLEEKRSGSKVNSDGNL